MMPMKYANMIELHCWITRGILDLYSFGRFSRAVENDFVAAIQDFIEWRRAKQNYARLRDIALIW
ncbi:hypothetical protein I6F35_27455 [Bradyrhizobium sp. BRP22]|uniref:hypothetical protein n=1 Tax=Bradyrhizobium sp. BRP22 TaxID=2793821 RepID=UPI001CD7A6C7|nr:hypothetical protein [Bradyrhizobium sp. BRP22]MCA1456912.1 hypothetical protein [Bradyrhizobium sp. BRP22]